jgi:uncharacterized protein (TIRG00374 family)
MRRAITILKFGLSGLLLYIFLRRTDFSGIISALSHFSFGLIACLTVLNIGAVFVTAWKWRLLLPEARFARLAAACFASYYVALLLPGQVAQEGAKAYYVSRERSLSRAKLAASLLVDKMASIIGLLLVGGVGLFLSQKRLPASLTALFVIVAVATLIGMFSLRLPAIYSWARGLCDSMGRRWPKQQRLALGLRHLFEAWHLYSRNLSVLAVNIVLSAAYQLVGVVMFYLVSRDLNVVVGFFDWSWITAGLTLALFLPLTIGGLGIREGALIGILQLYGYGAETAVAISLTAFSFLLMLAAIGLGVALWQKGRDREANSG